MKVISTNIAQPYNFIHNGKEVTTGINKKPTDVPIYLGKDIVRGDEVSNRKAHGGEFKACYLFSANQYPFWQNLYPNLNWTYGMLGENLTIEDLNETQLFVGDIYKLGGATVQITIPREPCYKFAHKFDNDAVLQQFIDNGYSGSYVKVIEEGEVKVGDNFQCIKSCEDSISIFLLFQLIYAKNKNIDHIHLAINNDAVPQKLKKRLERFIR